MPKTDVLEKLRARIAWHRKFEPAPVSILVDAAAEIERLRAMISDATHVGNGFLRVMGERNDLLEALEFLIPAAEECMLLAGEGTLSENDEVILARARAAVAKAKGETTC